ncbi:MAG: hypothetical protein R3B93_08670 [Bacteroidia bacterium]
MVVEVARKIGEAGTRFATHNWRSAASGNLVDGLFQEPCISLMY